MPSTYRSIKYAGQAKRLWSVDPDTIAECGRDIQTTTRGQQSPKQTKTGIAVSEYLAAAGSTVQALGTTQLAAHFFELAEIVHAIQCCADRIIIEEQCGKEVASPKQTPPRLSIREDIRVALWLDLTSTTVKPFAVMISINPDREFRDPFAIFRGLAIFEQTRKN